MKLTPKQNEVINKYKQLEAQYGKGNVFLRYINDYWKIRFIIHEIGDRNYCPVYDYRINGKIITFLESKGLLIGYDSEHKETDPNNWRSYKEGVYFCGSRINLNKL